MNPFLPGLTPPDDAEPPLVWSHGSLRLLTVARGEGAPAVRLLVQTLDDRVVAAIDAAHGGVVETGPDNVLEFRFRPQLPPGLYRLHAVASGETATRTLEIRGQGQHDSRPAATLVKLPFDPGTPPPDAGNAVLFPIQT